MKWYRMQYIRISNALSNNLTFIPIGESMTAVVSRATGLLQYVEHHIAELLKSADSEGLKRVEEKEKEKEREREREREKALERGRALAESFQVLDDVEFDDALDDKKENKGSYGEVTGADEQDKEKDKEKKKGEKGEKSGDMVHLTSEENLSEESESRVQEGIRFND